MNIYVKIPYICVNSSENPMYMYINVKQIQQIDGIDVEHKGDDDAWPEDIASHKFRFDHTKGRPATPLLNWRSVQAQPLELCHRMSTNISKSTEVVKDNEYENCGRVLQARKF